jgi:hypothetical protein
MPHPGFPDSTARASVDWFSYKPMLTCHDLATIYPYTLRTIRDMAAARNRKIPTPCGTRPFVFRREDVRRHYERMEA